MSHTFNEMFPKEAAANRERIAQILRIRKQLEHVSLREFKASDLPLLLNVMGNDHREPTSHELNYLEQKIADLLLAP